ncbi:MAG: sugar phosphate nucleotidyltransferase [Promethearchaeota archaeon]
MSLLKNNFKEKLGAIILCAGEGKRLKKITKSLPKPLIKIDKLNKIPIINHILNNLIDLEINHIAVVIGYLGDTIRKAISSLKKSNNFSQINVVVIDAKNQYKLGPLYSFLSITKNKSFFSSNYYYIVIPGDTVFDKDILKEILDLLSKNYNLIHDSPFIFYRNIKLKVLKQIYKKSRLVSIAELIKVDSNVVLKRISQVKIKDIISSDEINQIIPIFTFNYNFIQEILALSDHIHLKTIWETFNYMIDNSRKIYAFKINSNKQFYDIDSKDDLKNLKKKERTIGAPINQSVIDSKGLKKV